MFYNSVSCNLYQDKKNETSIFHFVTCRGNLKAANRYRKKTNMELCHLGTCTATQWGRRYGKYTEAQRFDDVGHRWSLAKDKNWGPWSCCGNAANSPGCKGVNTHSKHQAVCKKKNQMTKGAGSGELIYFLGEDTVSLVTGDTMDIEGSQGQEINAIYELGLESRTYLLNFFETSHATSHNISSHNDAGQSTLYR